MHMHLFQPEPLDIRRVDNKSRDVGARGGGKCTLTEEGKAAHSAQLACSAADTAAEESGQGRGQG